MTKARKFLTAAFAVAIISVSWLGSAEAGLFSFKQVITTPLGSVGVGVQLP
jgi:hypothetical protein